MEQCSARRHTKQLVATSSPQREVRFNAKIIVLIHRFTFSMVSFIDMKFMFTFLVVELSWSLWLESIPVLFIRKTESTNISASNGQLAFLVRNQLISHFLQNAVIFFVRIKSTVSLFPFMQSDPKTLHSCQVSMKNKKQIPSEITVFKVLHLRYSWSRNSVVIETHSRAKIIKRGLTPCWPRPQNCRFNKCFSSVSTFKLLWW